MDLEEGVLQNLGTRRPPSQGWTSVAGPLIERQAVKQQRRQDLAAGSFPDPPAKGKGPGLDSDCSIRRRDTHFMRAASRSARQCRAESIAQQLKMKLEPIDTSLSWLSPEEEHGPIEYKYKINNPHPIRLQQLITQLKFRLSEGAGQAFYYIGVEDDGYPKGLGAAELDASIATLHHMSRSLRAHATVVRVFPGAHGRQCALLKVQRGTVDEVSYTDLRVAVAGCVDAGKSTLVAVLTHGSNGQPCLDTGRGSARVAVLRHKHEIESGRTSSLSQQLLGYDSEGKVLNYTKTSVATMSEVASVASKVLTFIDMGGHEKCLKTALYGMTALLPDYALLCCCAVRGLGHMSREHLAVAVALQIPVAVIITKADLVDEAGLAATVQEVRALIALAWQSLTATDTPWVPSATAAVDADVITCTPVIEDEAGARQAVHLSAACRTSTRAAPGSESGAGGSTADCAPGAQSGAGIQQPPGFMCPIIPVSCVTGKGLDCLHAFLHALEPTRSTRLPPAPLVTASAPDLTRLSGSPSLPATAASSGLSTAGTSTCNSVATSTADLTQLSVSASLPGDVTHDRALDAADSVTSPTTLTAADDISQVHFQVDHTYEVAGVGSVVSGMAVSGLIQVGQCLLLGPTPTPSGDFIAVEVTGIQRAHIPVRQVRAGQAATLALSLVSSTAAPHSDTALGIQTGQQEQQPGAKEPGTTGPAVSDSTLQPEAHTAAVPSTQVTQEAEVQTPAAPDLEVQVQAAPAHNPGASTGSGLVQGGLMGQAPVVEKVDVAPDLLELFTMDSEEDETGVQQGAGTGNSGGVEDLGGLFGEDDSSTRRERGYGRNARRRSRERRAALAASSQPSGVTAQEGCEQVRVERRGPERANKYRPLPYIPNHTSERRGGPSRRPSSSWCSRPAASGDQPHDPQVLHESSKALEECNLATSLGAPSFLRHASPSAHRGAVLLGAGVAPRTAWGFEAVLVLLGGHWPARGLVSGAWPPQEENPADVAEPTAGGAGEAMTGATAAAVVGASGGDSSSWCGGSTPNSCSEDVDAGRGKLAGRAAARRVSWAAGDNHIGGASSDDMQQADCQQGSDGQRRTQVHNGPADHADDLAQIRCHASPDVRYASSVPTPGLQRPEQRGQENGHVCNSPPGGEHRTRRRRTRRTGSYKAHYTSVIHCANVRQLARLTFMQELHRGVVVAQPGVLTSTGPQTGAPGMGHDKPVLVTPSMLAAASLLHAAWQPRVDVVSTPPAAVSDSQPVTMPGCSNGAPAMEGSASPPPTATQCGGSLLSPRTLADMERMASLRSQPDMGCLVTATFRFEHRPEWLCEGARLVVRDRSTGHVSAAGYIRNVLLSD